MPFCSKRVYSFTSQRSINKIDHNMCSFGSSKGGASGPLNALILVAAVLLSAIPSTHASHEGTSPATPSRFSFQGSVPDNRVQHVIHIVMDGLRSDYLAKGGPAFSKLLKEGACTLNARHDWASSQTLPNHIGMFTGLIVDQHGFSEDKDDGGKLVDADEHPFENIFDLVAANGGKTGFYGSKDKFAVFDRSWKMDHYEMQLRAKNLVPIFLEDMNTKLYNFAFLHVRSADRAGHKDSGNGNGGAAKPMYLEAVQEADGYLGQVMDLIEQNAGLRGKTAIIVTADHGFADYGNHGDEQQYENFRVPFCVSAPGVAPGADLAKLNAPSNGGIVVDPGNSRGGEYDPIIRNSYSAVLAADFLGIKTSDGPFSNQYLSVGDKPTAATGSIIEASSAEDSEEEDAQEEEADEKPDKPEDVADEKPDKPEDQEEEDDEKPDKPEEPTEEAEEIIPLEEEDEWDIQDQDGPTEEEPSAGFDWEQWLVDRPHWNVPSPTGGEETTVQEVQEVASTNEEATKPTVVSSEEMLLLASEYTSITEETPDKPYEDKNIVIGEGIDALILFEMPQELDSSTIGSTVLQLRVLSGEDKFKDAKVYQTTGNWLDRTMGWDSAPAADAELGKLVSWQNAEGDVYATVELSLDELKIMDGRLLLRIEPKKKDMVVFDPDAKLSVKYTK